VAGPAALFLVVAIAAALAVTHLNDLFLGLALTGRLLRRFVLGLVNGSAWASSHDA
jgi:hypothetical protein